MGIWLIKLRNPSGDFVYVNPDAVVSVRVPFAGEYHEGVKTVIELTNGKRMGIDDVLEEVVEILRACGGAWA